MQAISQEEYAQTLTAYRKVKMELQVATALAQYFCAISNYTGPLIDVQWEIKIQAKRLLRKWVETEDGPKKVRKELEGLSQPERRRK